MRGEEEGRDPGDLFPDRSRGEVSVKARTLHEQ